MMLTSLLAPVALLGAALTSPDDDAPAVGDVLAPPTSPAEVLDLSLQDAIATAFAHNPSLRRTRLEAEAAYAGFGAAWGVFDSAFFTDVTRRRRSTPESPDVIVLGGGLTFPASPKFTNNVFNVNSGFRGQLTSGTTWQASVNLTDTTTNQSTGEWTLSLTHPFLRGGEDQVMADVQLSAQDVLIAAANDEDNANTLIRQVIEAYWNLVYARQNLETRELSVILAEELLGITNRKFDQGLQNRIDVIENEAEVARRQEERLTAANTVEQTVDDLYRLVFAPEGADLWIGSLQPVTDYTALPEDVLGLDSAVTVALDRRADVRSARRSVQRAELEIQRAENQAEDRLDVTASYGVNTAQLDIDDALYRLDDTSYNEYLVTLNYEVPIGNRSAGYQLRRRQIDRERALVSLRETELATIAAVRQAERDLSLQQARVVSTAETTRLRTEVYEGEKRRLENDLSTPFEVRQNQRDLLEAIDAETRARLDLAIAHTAYQAAMGTLLETFGYRPYEVGLDLEEAPVAP